MQVSIKEKIIGFIRMLRVEISPLGMLCVYLGAAISTNGYYFSFKLLLAMTAVFLIGAGSSAFNDYFDYEIDKISHPNHVLNLGILKRKTALYTGVTFFAIALALSIFINPSVFFLAVIAVALICFYELASKERGFIGNIVVSITIAISFNYGGAVVGNIFSPLPLTLISFFLILGREIMLDVRDFEGDILTRTSLPIVIGRKKATFFACCIVGISLFLFVSTVLFYIISFWFLILISSVILLGIYAIVLPFLDVENVSRSTDVLRFSMIQILIVFVLILYV